MRAGNKYSKHKLHSRVYKCTADQIFSFCGGVVVSRMDLKKTIACCVVLVWTHVCFNIVLIRHALGAKIVQAQNYGLDHVQTFTLLTGLGVSENFTTQVANLSEKSMLLKTQPATIHSLCSSIGSV